MGQNEISHPGEEVDKHKSGRTSLPGHLRIRRIFYLNDSAQEFHPSPNPDVIDHLLGASVVSDERKVTKRAATKWPRCRM